VPPGSRVGVRVCETAAQREAREAAVRATRDQLSRPTPGCAQIGPGGCPGGGWSFSDRDFQHQWRYTGPVLALTYHPLKNLEIRGGDNNVADKDPPV